MKTPFQELIFDPELIRRFDINGPRYTSYPTADRFVEAFNGDSHRLGLANRNPGLGARKLSLYVHVPFCNTICYYCACNKIITKDHGRSAKYIRYLGREMALKSEALQGSHEVIQLHWGGGTPTFLTHDEMSALIEQTTRYFSLTQNGEYSIEIDPRKVGTETVEHLANLGFNRMSLGVQDFDPIVQKSVNRVQSLFETRNTIEAARASGFQSVSIDLIYGLPHQTVASFTATVEAILDLAPDRISIYNYAHVPSLAKPQRRINEADLPNAQTKLAIQSATIARLLEADYVFIGMDHFARPDDELAKAQRQGLLHRNFQGYSTYANSDLLAFGVSAISKVGSSYCQNFRTLEPYYDFLERGRLPVMRGIALTPDDLLRLSIIQALMCQFELSIESIEVAHLISFRDYFAQELVDLAVMERENLISLNNQWLTVLPRGRMLVRVIAMVFDKYLRADHDRFRYSKVI